MFYKCFLMVVIRWVLLPQCTIVHLTVSWASRKLGGFLVGDLGLQPVKDLG